MERCEIVSCSNSALASKEKNQNCILSVSVDVFFILSVDMRTRGKMKKDK